MVIVDRDKGGFRIHRHLPIWPWQAQARGTGIMGRMNYAGRKKKIKGASTSIGYSEGVGREVYGLCAVLFRGSVTLT